MVPKKLIRASMRRSFMPANSDQLLLGESLGADQFLSSLDGRHTLVYQGDGNLVLYKVYRNQPRKPLWASNTAGSSVGNTVMQSDGNLVVYDVGGNPLWASNTAGNPGSRLVMQDDGNVVVYSPSNGALWASDTSGQIFAPTGSVAVGNSMQPGEVLNPEESISSADRQFFFIYQRDGNLVLYRLLDLAPLWASNTVGQPAEVCIMQSDGNLVIYDGDANPFWASNTAGNPGSRLVMQDDGNVVIYTPDSTPIWSTNTSQLDGPLVRESSSPKVYIIYNNKKIWIPTPDALFAMGYNWDSVRIVADGMLDFLPEVRIDSASPTPGSLVFPPWATSHYAITGVNKSTRIVSQGREIRLIELYGWLYPEPGGEINTEDRWDDYHYMLEVDSAWTVAQGIDLNQILKVGNIIISEGYAINKGSLDAYRSSSLPRIGIEINGWKPRNTRGVQRPSDWTATIPELSDTCWPYDPRIPLTGGRDEEAAALYVRLVGSLISDIRHSHGASEAWAAGRPPVVEDDPARHTEIHPPDRIEVLSSNQNRKETLHGIAVVAGNSIIDAAEQEVRARIAPPGPRPSPYHRAAVVEMVGPETNTNTIIAGNRSKTGALISYTDKDVEVYVKVARTGWPGGSPGKFKALYRVFWEEGPHTLSVHVEPSTLPLKQPVQVTIMAEDTFTRAPISGRVMINGRDVGSTNIPFSYSFQVVKRRERHYDPESGEFITVITTTVVGVDGKVIANGYTDADFNIPDVKIEGDI